MADIAEVLAHVERTEYLKELARLIAKDIGDEVDLEKALTDPGFAENLIDDLIGALEDHRVLTGAASNASRFAATIGLDSLSEADRHELLADTVAQIMEQGGEIVGSAVKTLVDRVGQMSAAGVGDEVISAAIGASDLGASISSSLASIAGSIVTQIERDTLAQAREDFSTPTDGPQDAQAPEEPPDWRWVTMEDDRVCEGVIENSCAPRHDQELSEDEWGFMGLPGGFNLICSYYAKGPSSNCRCFLEPAEGSRTSPSPVNVSAAIASGKSRAEDDWENAA